MACALLVGCSSLPLYSAPKTYAQPEGVWADPADAKVEAFRLIDLMQDAVGYVPVNTWEAPFTITPYSTRCESSAGTFVMRASGVRAQQIPDSMRDTTAVHGWAIIDRIAAALDAAGYGPVNIRGTRDGNGDDLSHDGDDLASGLMEHEDGLLIKFVNFGSDIEFTIASPCYDKQSVSDDAVYPYPTWDYQQHPIPGVTHLDGKYAPWAAIATQHELTEQQTEHLKQEWEYYGGATTTPAPDPTPQDHQTPTPTPSPSPSPTLAPAATSSPRPEN
ncbi:MULTISPECIES: hypothetical protein [unclassified Pseudoclavibacter]|uniref:hypothetical protein n=1 Tax=unclassified Pseudoclavibacter TaxID=2615177 RepID=UPI001300D923|nr:MULTISPECIES: hypothetical protein [unclassified Pseudoclavibacter]KAB1645706.1 hypothetical protein F8O06_09115 [Pseudoclavibacter sp. CFCC 14310]KAB1664386.1 hypothetical protein F8O08_03040 [Pseudoclavibacter sp. CFCC 13611]